MPRVQAERMDRNSGLRDDSSQRPAQGRLRPGRVPGLRVRDGRRTAGAAQARRRRHAAVLRKRSTLSGTVPVVHHEIFGLEQFHREQFHREQFRREHFGHETIVMKLPLSWLAEFVTLEADVDELCRRLTLAGLEVENVERAAPGFSDVFVARVLKVERHPNADRLNLCEVDAGAVGRFSVVCGAPNVRAGMIAPFARLGARLIGSGRGGGQRPASLQDAPPLEAAVIRGVRSEGMLCSERELGFSDDHAGIVALPDDAPLGVELASYLRSDDTVLDIAITPNRGDCLSILGLAREVAALFGLKLKQPAVKSAMLKPRGGRTESGAELRAESQAGSINHASDALAVEILAPELCPHYVGLPIGGVKIGPSPIWMRRRLELCGMRALNNVVDATNYVMLELGQPLHAFDSAQIAARRIVVRRADQAPGGAVDREFVTLDNVRRTLDPADLLIADPEKPLAIAGIMGGLNSEVSAATTDLVLESAYFEPMTIARTARRLGLRSEASYRFERA